MGLGRAVTCVACLTRAHGDTTDGGTDQNRHPTCRTDTLVILQGRIGLPVARHDAVRRGYQRVSLLIRARSSMVPGTEPRKRRLGVQVVPASS